MGKISDIINRTNAFYCVDCGKCTSACPLSRFGDYSPDRLVERALLGLPIQQDLRLWSCLTCNRCKEACTYGVEYPEFIREIRSVASNEREKGVCAHGELFSLMKLFTFSHEREQERLKWVSKDLKVSEKGDILYFTGCLPYFDIVFRDLGVNTVEIARSTTKILNKLGISPVVMNNEVCCGHDLFWNGDIETFKELAARNIQNINDTGAKKVIFSCPEGYRTFKLDYPEFFDFDFEVVHISEFLLEQLEEGKLELHKVDDKVTYHDSCRLGRHLGIYDAPRKVIAEIAGDFVELASNKENSLCCGTSGWTNCDGISEEIRRERLNEGIDTGAKMMVTACPKCLIHFKCHMSNRKGDYEIEIVPFENLVARAMGLI
ncbi:Fe-S oxidoreductase [Methanophagales archaeon]|nr:Fe-S oxidoreductase [Methanophagales archaeon]